MAQPLNPQPDCLDFELLPATPLVPAANSIRVYADATSGDLAAIKADGTSALPGGMPAGATGDVQFNNGGAFGNANDVFSGAVLEIDGSENLIIDLSSGGGGVVFTGGAFIADVTGNLDFESTGGDVTFQSSGGGVTLQGTQVQVAAIGGNVTIGSDNGTLIITEAGAVTLVNTSISIPGLQVFANNAAALSGGLVATNLYRTSTGQVMAVF